jgi:hypothetical protein
VSSLDADPGATSNTHPPSIPFVARFRRVLPARLRARPLRTSSAWAGWRGSHSSYRGSPVFRSTGAWICIVTRQTLAPPPRPEDSHFCSDVQPRVWTSPGRGSCLRSRSAIDAAGRLPAPYRRNALMTARAPSTPIGGTRIGRSVPAARKAASCCRQCASGPSRQTASRRRSLSEPAPTPFSI